ncbi:MAG: hypothetical protein ACMUIP_07805 [bacterium]
MVENTNEGCPLEYRLRMYVNNELEGKEKEQIDKHLPSCPQWWAKFEDMIFKDTSVSSPHNVIYFKRSIFDRIISALKKITRKIIQSAWCIIAIGLYMLMRPLERMTEREIEEAFGKIKKKIKETIAKIKETIKKIYRQ